MLVKLLPFLLLGLIVSGGYNYHRNAYLDAELENNRPYKSLRSEELDVLIEAYRAEKKRIEQKLAQTTAGEDPMDRYAPGDLDGKLRGFEQVQKRSDRQREVRGQALEHQVEIERIEREREIRAQGLDQEWTRVLRRVVTL